MNARGSQTLYTSAPPECLISHLQQNKLKAHWPLQKGKGNLSRGIATSGGLQAQLKMETQSGNLAIAYG